MNKKILIGDIGGTKTELALVSHGNIFERCEKFISKDYPSLEKVIVKFLQNEKVDSACFGVAGPVKNGICQTTNLPWMIDVKIIRKLLGIEEVCLLNDLTASAYAIPGLSENSLYTINRGDPTLKGTIALISPGTGLGEGLIIQHNNGYLPIDSEGGHSDFAPRSIREVELFWYLKKKYPHVSYERILSGAGISDLYTFLTGGEIKSPEKITEDGLSFSSLNANITALKWFCEILGAESSNLVLKGYATGGIYIGGGIPIKILEILKGEDFMRGFLDKGRFNNLLKNIPIHVVLDPQITLFGALFFANV